MSIKTEQCFPSSASTKTDGVPKKRILIYYRYFGKTLGGGEYLPLMFISELQKNCEVTLALEWTSHVERAIQCFEIPVNLTKLKIIQVMPKWYHSNQNGIFLSFYRFQRLRRLSRDADVCISMANIMDFGKPAHYFLITSDLGDEAFQSFISSHTLSRNMSSIRKLRLFLMDQCLRPLLGMRSKKSIICDPEEHIYPNSFYVDHLLHQFYGACNTKVFYPPTTFEFESKDVLHDPCLVVYLGRISPAKRVVDIVEIVERARAISGKEIRLSLAGHLGSVAFKEKLSRLTEGKNWIDFPGEKYGKEKERFLLSGTYAIHAMREEAFGISVTEYLKAGLIPIVPDEGGSCEVVDNRDLTFHTNEEAANILVKLLNDQEFRERQRRLCEERAKVFSKAAYLERQHKLLQDIVGV